MKRRIYLSGGMSGVERAEYVRRFGEAEAILRRHGYGCINPCRVWACRWPWIYRAMEWAMGEHRLMCGDSTKAEDVAKLMNGERADLVFTDPPYGMNLTPNYKSIHKNHQAKAVDYQPIIGDQDVFDARFIFDLFDDTKEIFLWGADYFRHTIPFGGSWIVWDKTCGKHEGRIGNEFELCWSKQQHKKEIIRMQWAGFVGMEEEDGERVHPTQKPVRLAGWFLSKYSTEGNIVADIFGGSGSTMIACEQLGRKCRMMELDPHYCTVIIARWEKLTGQKAVKLNP